MKSILVVNVRNFVWSKIQDRCNLIGFDEVCIIRQLQITDEEELCDHCSSSVLHGRVVNQILIKLLNDLLVGHFSRALIDLDFDYTIVVHFFVGDWLYVFKVF